MGGALGARAGEWWAGPEGLMGGTRDCGRTLLWAGPQAGSEKQSSATDWRRLRVETLARDRPGPPGTARPSLRACGQAPRLLVAPRAPSGGALTPPCNPAPCCVDPPPVSPHPLTVTCATCGYRCHHVSVSLSPAPSVIFRCHSRSSKHPCGPRE